MRLFHRLTDLDDDNPYYIRHRNYRESITIPYRTALLNVVGADGAFDLHGDLRAPLGAGAVSFEYDIITACAKDTQAEVERLLSALEGNDINNGLRKLWRHEDENGGDQRFTWARPLSRPALDKDWLNRRHVHIPLQFALPDPKFYQPLKNKWLTDNSYTPHTFATLLVPEDIDPNLTFAEFPIAATPFNFTIINDGDTYSQHVIFRLESEGVNGFTNPKITNNTTGQWFQSTTDGDDNQHILSFRSSVGLGQVMLSENAGAGWTDDTLNLTLGTVQAVMMELAPGSNSFTYTDGGAPNLTLYVWWLHAWRD